MVKEWRKSVKVEQFRLPSTSRLHWWLVVPPLLEAKQNIVAGSFLSISLYSTFESFASLLSPSPILLLLRTKGGATGIDITTLEGCVCVGLLFAVCHASRRRRWLALTLPFYWSPFGSSISPIGIFLCLSLHSHSLLTSMSSDADGKK